MKKARNLLIAISLLPTLLMAQNTSLDSATYDFWVGKWDPESGLAEPASRLAMFRMTMSS